MLFLYFFFCLYVIFLQLAVFDHDIESFDGKIEWQQGTDAVKDQLTKFVQNTKPRGGTEVLYSSLAPLSPLSSRVSPLSSSERTYHKA